MTKNPSSKIVARLMAKHPGMCLGGSSYDHAIGLLIGLASLAYLRSGPATEKTESGTEFSAGDRSSLLAHIAETERDQNSDVREAIRALEPLLAEALEEVLGSDARNR